MWGVGGGRERLRTDKDKQVETEPEKFENHSNIREHKNQWLSNFSDEDLQQERHVRSHIHHKRQLPSFLPLARVMFPDTLSFLPGRVAGFYVDLMT